jgi:purine-binding chemotaxis protein CheW
MFEPATAVADPPARAGTGKYLLFALGQEEYALELAKTREVLGLVPITPVPGTPKFVRGVTSFRGAVLPVIDLRVAFGLPARDGEHTGILVAASGDVEIGLVVDRVTGMIDVGPEAVRETPTPGGETATAAIRGIRRDHGNVTIILDVGMVLAPAEARALAQGTGEGS